MGLLIGNGSPWLGSLLLALAIALLVWLWRLAGAEDRRRTAARRRHRELHGDLDRRLDNIESYLFGSPLPNDDEEWRD